MFLNNKTTIMTKQIFLYIGKLHFKTHILIYFATFCIKSFVDSKLLDVSFKRVSLTCLLICLHKNIYLIFLSLGVHV